MITPTKEFWEVFKSTPGALSTAEALAIMNIAAQAPEGLYMELGTYKGKSAMSASVSLKEGVFYLVEPEFEDENWSIEVLNKVFRLSTNHISPKSIANYSTAVIQLYKKYAYVFIDSGSHQDGLPMQEVKLLEDRMVQGGILAFHDYKNQFTEVEGAYNYLVGTGKYEHIEINWDEIFQYVKEHDLEANNNSWHVYPDLPHPPNFVGALKRK